MHACKAACVGMPLLPGFICCVSIGASLPELVAAYCAGTSAGVGFAIPIDIARSVVPQLIQFGKVVRPALNIQVTAYLLSVSTHCMVASQDLTCVSVLSSAAS